MMTSISQKQGSVVAVSHDMIMVRYEGKGVLFKKPLLSRCFKNDDIVQFSAKKASTMDIEVGGELANMANYNIEWVGTEIKYIKPGRMLVAEGSVITIPDTQYMFVDWKYTKNPPSLAKIPGYSKPLTTNVFITKATVRPEIVNLAEMFKPGQRVKFVAREQAPNERGVCWRAALATDEYHEIVTDAFTSQGRQTHRVIPKAGVVPHIPGYRPSLTAPAKPLSIVPPATPSNPYPGQRPLMRPVAKPIEQSKITSSPASASGSNTPSTSVTTKRTTIPLDVFSTDKEACIARFKRFAADFRKNNPNNVLSQKCFEGCLKVQYLNNTNDDLSALRDAYAEI